MKIRSNIDVATGEVTATRLDLEGKEGLCAKIECIPAKRLSYMVRTAPQCEPESWKETQKLPVHEKQKQIEAADEQINSLKDLQTWELTALLTRKHAIECKLVFKTKCDSEGKAHHYKARPAAKGYTQKYGEDYDGTFASVAEQSTFRTLLAGAAA